MGSHVRLRAASALRGPNSTEIAGSILALSACVSKYPWQDTEPYIPPGGCRLVPVFGSV